MNSINNQRRVIFVSCVEGDLSRLPELYLDICLWFGLDWRKARALRSHDMAWFSHREGHGTHAARSASIYLRPEKQHPS
jgi:hypothetical protein